MLENYRLKSLKDKFNEEANAAETAKSSKSKPVAKTQKSKKVGKAKIKK